MAYTKKTWYNKSSQNRTPVNATNMNDLETRIKALDTSIDDMIGLTTGTTKSIPNNLRINGADLNEISGTGMFVAFGPCTNVPMYEGVVTNHWHLIQIEYSPDYRYQMIQRLSGTGGDFFTRTKVSGTWNSWKKIVVENDWVTPTLENNFEIYNSNYSFRYRRIGDVIYIQGCVKPKEAIAVGDAMSKREIIKLPSGYRPTTPLTFTCRGVGKNLFQTGVNTVGEVYVERYGTTTEDTIPVGAGLYINISFALD